MNADMCSRCWSPNPGQVFHRSLVAPTRKIDQLPSRNTRDDENIFEVIHKAPCGAIGWGILAAERTGFVLVEPNDYWIRCSGPLSGVLSHNR